MDIFFIRSFEVNLTSLDVFVDETETQGNCYMVRVLGERCRLRAGFCCRGASFDQPEEDFLAFYWVKEGWFGPDTAQILPVPNWVESFKVALQFAPTKYPSAEPYLKIYCPFTL